MFKENQPASVDTKTIIGASVNVEGDFNSKGDVLIVGRLKGSVKTLQNITVGQSAVVQAEVEAANAHIAGTIIGNLTVKEKVELTKTAKIKGNLLTKELSIEAGAVFNGNCSMGDQEIKPANKKEA